MNVPSLRRERPPNDFVGNRYLKTIVALDARNRLVGQFWKSSTGINVNVLLGFAAWAFHRHQNITLVSHSFCLRLHSTIHGSSLLAVLFYTCCMWSILVI